MIFALFFVCTRLSQIATLLCTMSMLAWFINIFVGYNALTPNPILIIFIVSVIALTWAVFTLFTYHRSSHNALFVSFVDALILGALIAATYFISPIRLAQCDDANPRKYWANFVGGDQITGLGYEWGYSKPCNMLKACFAFGIMNCLMFGFTSFVAWMHGDKIVIVEERRHHHPRNHSRRHSHRGSRSRSGDSRYSRSEHSHRRVYV
ncbi:hypothetical protein VHEMI04704 [[Torrubiella] hemipterigena]|uniref:MARVEL domain-containing protein n=1 Tax=[Torrubiella] hemipterigena TaxID=1531966 RepID=A0A0A1T1Z6_9HYPO|nr:hypothetical protein VHEMI04704 [[Torrubiella] hemipterigena]